jgi:hypothetical protein
VCVWGGGSCMGLQGVAVGVRVVGKASTAGMVQGIPAVLRLAIEQSAHAACAHCGCPACADVCRAVPCRAVRCRAVPCRAVPCRAVPCRAVLSFVVCDVQACAGEPSSSS